MKKTLISAYRFGSLTIAFRTYTSDLILWPDRVRENWWRNQGHSLSLEDLEEVLADPPERLLIGRGHDGAMQVPAATLAALEERGIKVHAMRTTEAVKLWNDWLQAGERRPKVVAALHLTC
jgi:hypothetical protein